jgi:hypothetical protein
MDTLLGYFELWPRSSVRAVVARSWHTAPADVTARALHTLRDTAQSLRDSEQLLAPFWLTSVTPCERQRIKNKKDDVWNGYSSLLFNATYATSDKQATFSIRLRAFLGTDNCFLISIRPPGDMRAKPIITWRWYWGTCQIAHHNQITIVVTVHPFPSFLFLFLREVHVSERSLSTIWDYKAYIIRGNRNKRLWLTYWSSPVLGLSPLLLRVQIPSSPQILLL